VGLGPRGTSLAQRVSLPPPVWSNAFSMMLEGLARAEARRERAVWHRMKHAVARKPEAPVIACHVKQRGEERLWRWYGESIESKGLYHDMDYATSTIRKAGFKMPKIGGKK
jgi:hypothetical protein